MISSPTILRELRTAPSTDARPTKDDEEEAKVVVPAPDTKDPETLVRHLSAHEPLKLALVRDFPLVLRKLKKTARGIKAMSAEAVGEENLHKGLGWLHYRELSACFAA